MCKGEHLSPRKARKYPTDQANRKTAKCETVNISTEQQEKCVYTNSWLSSAMANSIFTCHTATRRIWPEGVLCRGAEEFACTHTRSVLHSSFVLCKNCRTWLHLPHVDSGSRHWGITLIFTGNFTNEETKNRKTLLQENIFKNSTWLGSPSRTDVC